MRALGVLSYTLAITAALLGGCGGVQLPIHEQVAAAPAALSRSDLLYVADNGNGDLYVYTYPQGRIVQKIQYSPLQDPAGDCIDDRGNVFVTGYNGHDVLVYRHGAEKPYLILEDPGYPIGCSINLTTHNLAVANAMDRDAGPGNVAVWKDPILSGSSGPSFIYSNPPFIEPAWCAYDDQGNLFVDGGDYSQRTTALAEIPNGGTAFNSISLSVNLSWPPGDIQWDGQYISIGAGNIIYQLSFSTSTGQVVGSTQLPPYWSLHGYSIFGATPQRSHRKLVATAGESIGFFQYPSGKGPSKRVSQDEPTAAVVSPAQR